ncbi:hypothetical protein TRAPUB_11208 [Trametes pubescens]|uniref:Uncharacterized protein n=1 Tax=Trametes pubescens TaxID=154538 RepID=A0A1M2VXG8_TRAPU|nr:hypothetical protein TRAPUB_11208 [Trametes pubescens]
MIHHYELMVIATATVGLQGGYALHFSPDTPKTIGFAVLPLPKFVASLLSGTLDDNPGKGFHIVNALSMSKDMLIKRSADTEGALDWERQLSACQAALAAGVLSKFGEDTACVGALLPGMFNIKHSPVFRVQPIFVIRQQHDRGGTLDEETRAILEDLRTICTAIMAAGLVLRPASSERCSDPWPDVGTLVRRKKKQWEWQPIPRWDWGRAALMVPRDLRKTDLHPKELWTRFFSL